MVLQIYPIIAPGPLGTSESFLMGERLHKESGLSIITESILVTKLLHIDLGHLSITERFLMNELLHIQ